MSQSSIPMSLPAYLHWKRIGLRGHHGISVPLFSIHSKRSCGIGEFPDLILLFQWLKDVQMDMIQILPINDSGIDISPYNAISGFALHPNFLGLAHLPYVNRHRELKNMILELQSYNTAPVVVYKQVTEKKYEFLRLYFSLYFAHFQKMQKYKSFVKKENAWLQPYALFKSLKEKFGNSAWWTWPKSFQFVTKEKLKAMYLEYASSMNFHIFVQYLCISQLRTVYKRANRSDILLTGDIPFLFNRDSVEVWIAHSLFDFRYTIGSPPDKMNPNGQNWGFPTYKWGSKKKDIFHLWKAKLQFAENFYHCYRIDHAIGLYRIWKIPEKKNASKGAFFPKSTFYYLKEGRRRLLQVLTMTKMLPIAEDLGYDIYPIRNNIAKIGVPGIRVMRWEHTETYNYISPADFSKYSVTTVATHDTSSLSLWWSSEKKEAHAYAKCKGWEYNTNLTTWQRYEILRDAHSSRSLLHINPIQEYLAFFVELSPSHPKRDQINIPGTNAESNWTYRCRPSIEELYAHSGLKSLIQKMIKS